MNPIFEYSDTLNNPYEAFFFDAQKNNFPVSPHWHYFMEILYILKGTAYIETDTDNYVLEPGDLIVFHPQTPHAIYAAGPFPLQYQVLKFDPVHLNIPGSSLPSISTLLHMIDTDKRFSCFFQKSELEHIPLHSLFDTMIQIVTEKTFGYDILAHSYYCILITELLKLWEKQGFSITSNALQHSQNETFSAVAEYIFQHYQEPICIETLARNFHMSYSHFSAKFKEYYGQTCGHFIKMVRIQKAEDLLRFTDFDLSYISQETGFCDCSHFIQVFQEFHGITPKKFRKNLHTT